MGMFDSIHLRVKCPNCGVEKVREGQTKDLDCMLLNLKVGDNTGFPDHTTVSCLFVCKEGCGVRGEHHAPVVPGFITTQGKIFYVDVKTPLGLITGQYIVYNEDGETEEIDYERGKEHYYDPEDSELND